MGSIRLRNLGSPLGIIPFLVPEWPDHRTYEGIVDCLRRHQPVAWEIAVPSSGWSQRTSDVIAMALEQSQPSLDRILAFSSGLKPSIAVLYRGILGILSRERLLERLSGKVDYIMLEWDAENLDEWRIEAEAQGIGLVRVADVRAFAAYASREQYASLPSGSILYLSGADKTGGESYPINLLRREVARAKQWCPELFVLTGFGVRNAEHVGDLATIEGLDAVAVGSELLRQAAMGVPWVDAFFSRLTTAGIATRASVGLLSEVPER